MAKPSWLTVSPTSGSGNGTISNSASSHTGRVARTGTVTVTATGLSTPKTYTVTQSGKPAFLSLQGGTSSGLNQKTYTVSKTGGTITVTGTTNSDHLWFSSNGTLPEGTNTPNTYVINGTTTVHGALVGGNTTVPNDPGADAQFTFTFEVTFPENTSTEAQTYSVVVLYYGSSNAQDAYTALFSQSAGDPTLELSATSVTIPYKGTAQTVTVTSNTSWTVS